ncbi:MAG: hypothetical protein LBR85_04835 [Oscillospiraceae bacterium]|jgi:hypothetical protein|nr:hypothetical protein [Oscillospiraceae bacterium]
MIKSRIMSRVFWALGASAALSVFYVISRHDVLGAWHNMFQWPVYLWIFGLVVILFSTFLSKRVVACVPVGYIAGFILAALFNTDSKDVGSAMANKGWQIWTISMIAVICAGIVWESICVIQKEKQRRRNEP